MKKNKYLFLVIAFTAMALALSSFVSVVKHDDSDAAKSDQIVADWERAKAFTLEYLAASNDKALALKPTAEMRSLGQQFLHLAEANYGLGSAASGKTNPVPFGSLEKSDQYKTKEAVTKVVTESYDFVIAAAKEMNDVKLGEMVKVFDFDMTREVAFTKAFEHQTHHRGQTTVYLRLSGITPPNEKLF